MTAPLGKKAAEKAREIIPWSQGQVEYKRIPKLSDFEGGTLGPGRWCLHTRSTVPLALVSTSYVGDHAITWGEVLEIPENCTGRVRNPSFHDGDIYLAAVGLAGIPSPRPKAITIPAVITSTTPPGAQAAVMRTSPLDTRFARAAYLVIPGLAKNLIHSIHYAGPTRGLAWSQTNAAAAAGEISVQRTSTGATAVHMLPLGIGSGWYVDALGNQGPNVEAMGLLDWLYVTADDPAASVKGFLPAANSFFLLEY